ncbi:MAG: cyclohexadienyl dehydratase [Pseudomonadota bacterium]|nr:cyclohexadienyl dehydratase [Pseudomonadota bacterium]
MIIPNKIRVGTTLDYPPFTYLNQETGMYCGFDVELICRLANNLGIEVEFIQTSWAQLEINLTNKLFDMAGGGISLTKARRQHFLVSSPTISDQKAILINKKHYNKIHNLADIDIPEITVIVNSGGTNQQFVQNNIKRAVVITTDDNLSIFAKLASGEADVMFTDLIEANYRQKLDDKLCVIIPQPPLTETIGYGYVFTQNNISLQNIIERELNQIMHTDFFKNLKQRFFA